MPTWVAAIAFISANLGAQEVIGMGASGAKYGLITCHFYWLAVPAMVFAGLCMMPFYYGSRARSVPEYLRLRSERDQLRHYDYLFLGRLDVRHG
jgi:SSS family solute:Na+ symporter